MTPTKTETIGAIVNDVRGNAAAVASRVVNLYEAPAWMRQDPLIVRSYRKQQDSFRGCFSSLWYVHNETINIWSHLCTGLCFLVMSVWAAFPALHGGYAFAASDVRALQIYLVGATLCCMFSAFYHCVSCHSQRVARRCLKLDYLGITFNITTTCISATYFGLYDQPFLANVYMTVIAACGVAAFWAVLDPNADGPLAARLRATIFIALGTSGFAPIAHGALSGTISLQGFSLEYIAAESAFYLLGTAIYVARIPEKYWSGIFDVWVSSARKISKYRKM
ncbi:MAG: hypothetical protein M1821_003860 [Bathelium mastoideum]|nr:MAG: hypothetical protein M1821_003860 [Bathelium mastoideum]